MKIRESGFGRPCVGLTNGGNYVDYNPTHSVTYEFIAGFHDDRLFSIAPKDAYHKHDCLAVLGQGEESIRQLSDWVDSLNELGATIEPYSTGATGLQAFISGHTNYAVKLPPIKPS